MVGYRELQLLVAPLFFLFLPYFVKASTSLPVASWPADQTLVFVYNTNLKLSDLVKGTGDKDSVSVDFGAHVSFNRVASLSKDGDLLEVKLSDARVGTEVLTAPEPFPAYLEMRGGAVNVLFVRNSETTFWTNLYKGIGSLVTARAVTGEQKEVDASGECMVAYSQGSDGHTIRREKKRCSPLDLTREVASRDEFRQMHRGRFSRTIFTIKEKRLETAQATEVVNIAVKATGQQLTATMEQNLEFKEQIQSKSRLGKSEETAEAAVSRLAVSFKVMRAVGLTPEEEGADPADEKALRALIEKHREALRLDQAASTPALEGFRNLLALTRHVRDVRVLTKVLSDEDLLDVTPVLADAYVACGTGPCLKAALDWVSLKNEDRAEESERLLLSLSLLTDPDEATLTRLLSDAKTMQTAKEGQEGVRAQLWATLGALVGRYSLSAAGRYASITAEISDFLISRLKESSNEDDTLAALNALANLRSTDPVPVCLELLANSKVSGRVRCAAIATIEALDVPSELRGRARVRVLRLFQSRPFFVDVASRLRALDLLLELHPTISQLVAAGKSVRADAHLRHAFLYRVRLWAKREQRQDAWERLNALVPDLLRYPGPAAAPPVLEEAEFGPGANFGLSLITGTDGGVRRSDTEAHLLLPNGDFFPLYQLGIFMDGLSSVAGAASGEEGAPAEDVTAGLSLRLFGASLRPVRFFNGMSGLMSAVWNAPSSLTPFLQTNMAFLEASHLILFQNGLSVRFSASGLASVDLSGLAAISMWNQRADTQLKSQAAVELSTRAQLTTSQFSMELLRRVSTIAAMDFNTQVTFTSTPPVMCLMASRPDTILEMLTERRAKIESEKNPLQEKKHETSVMPGVTLSLGRANERTCAKLVE